MKKLIFIAALALAGCQSEGERAEAEYDRIRYSGASQSQLCRSALAVSEAYRLDGKSQDAQAWAGYAESDCAMAYFTEGYRY